MKASMLQTARSALQFLLSFMGGAGAASHPFNKYLETLREIFSKQVHESYLRSIELLLHVSIRGLPLLKRRFQVSGPPYQLVPLRFVLLQLLLRLLQPDACICHTAFPTDRGTNHAMAEPWRLA